MRFNRADRWQSFLWPKFSWDGNYKPYKINFMKATLTFHKPCHQLSCSLSASRTFKYLQRSNYELNCHSSNSSTFYVFDMAHTARRYHHPSNSANSFVGLNFVIACYWQSLSTKTTKFVSKWSRLLIPSPLRGTWTKRPIKRNKKGIHKNAMNVSAWILDERFPALALKTINFIARGL